MTFVVDVRTDGGDRPTGDVVFTDGLETLGVVPVVAPGIARFTASDLAPGDHEIVAHYSGDAGCAPSWATFAQRVVHGEVTVDVRSSADPAPEQAPVDITATVAAHGTLHPTGEVTFHLGADRIGLVRLGEGGSATLRLPALPAGSHAITAAYGGDDRFAPRSCGLVQSVTAMSTLSLTTTPNPSRSGEAVTVAVHVESAAAGSRGGEVVCTVGPLEIGRAAVGPGGDAVCTVPALACGQHALVATYGGDDLTSPSSGVTTHVVERSTTTMLLTVADGPGPVGADPTDARQDDRVRDHA